ncbi:MAG: ribonuclease HII [Candidatus Dojkabacteria bacterium]|nr:MAG: ribonuclease HII [Candidatus Dojkabacteria bacterium]
MRGAIQYPDTELERRLWSSGFKTVVGLDEAGRGPWAGPVTAGAVIIGDDTQIVSSVRDSKKMSFKQREEAFEEIKESCVGWGIGEISSTEIDRVGIQKAVLMAMFSAIKQAEEMVGVRADYLIVDGKNVLLLAGYKMEKMNKGDANHYSIAAASVLAKVHRDRVMKQYAEKYPLYGFDSHMGYGTAAHRAALQAYGPTEIHRKTYKPVAALI